MKTLKENVLLMEEARASLSGKWNTVVICTLIYLLIIGGSQFIPVAGPLALFVVGGPIGLGYITICLIISRGGLPDVKQLFDGFKHFANAFTIYLFVGALVALGVIFLIVPGIYIACMYSMTWFIYADASESIGPMDAMKASRIMMNGHKMKFFYLMLRFIGWIILGIITLGIGLLWIMPYMQVSAAKFYDDIKD